MITPKMLDWVLNHSQSDREKNPAKFQKYMKRLQAQIDQSLDLIVRLAEERPEIVTDENSEILSLDSKNPLVPNRRLKAFLKILHILFPDKRVWLENEPS